MSDTAVAEAPAKPNRKLMQSQMQSAEYRRAEYVVVPPEGTTLSEMLDPNYWTHVASTLKAYDRIEVRWPGGIQWAELLVLHAERFAAKLHVLRHMRFDGVGMKEVQAPKGYSYKHRGPKAQWCIIRTEDGTVIQDQLPSVENADVWMRSYLQRLGKSPVA